MRFIEFLFESTPDEDPFLQGSNPLPTSDEEKLAHLEHTHKLAQTYYNAMAQTRDSLKDKISKYEAASSTKDAIAGPDTGTYYLPVAKPILDRLTTIVGKHDLLRTKIIGIEQEATKVRSGVIKKKVASHIASQATEKTFIIPENQIPPKISTVLNKPGKMENPYFKGDFYRYAGSVNGYQWTSMYWEYYIFLKEAFERNNIPGFTIIYASTILNKYKCTNFMAYAVDGKFCWKKYDVGGGSGQNNTFINGAMRSPLWQHTTETQDELLRKWFPEYFK
jgi:hypothetical protein